MAEAEETRGAKEGFGSSSCRNPNKIAETQNPRTTNAFDNTARTAANWGTGKDAEQGQERREATVLAVIV